MRDLTPRPPSLKRKGEKEKNLPKIPFFSGHLFPLGKGKGVRSSQRPIKPLSLLILFLSFLLLPTQPVQAHAELIGSNPSPGQVLTSFPTTVELFFSEQIDANSARAQLFNASGEVIATGKVRVNAASPRVLYVDLPAQPNGVYSLGWQVVSAVDGHETDGTVAFSVGLNSPRASFLPPPGTPNPASDLPAAAEVILRGLAYLATAVAVGGAVFAVLVWRPAFRQAGDGTGGGAESAADARATGLLKALVLFGALGGLLSMAAVLIYQSLLITAADTGPVWQTLLLKFGHHEGGLVWLRAGVLLLMAALSTLLPSAGYGRPGPASRSDTAAERGGQGRRRIAAAFNSPARPWWEIVGLGGILILTYSLSGHNAALGSPLPVVGDWLHFAAMAAWLGGLVPLGVLLWKRGQAAGGTPARSASSESTPGGVGLMEQVSRRFSRLALICVIVLGLSGLYSGLLQVRTLPALLGTSYGNVILLKSGLFALLVGLGALNQRGLIPRITRLGQCALGLLGRSVRVELGLAALVLLTVGGLMSLSPAYDALQADYRTGLHESWQGDGVSFVFRVAPVQVGENEIGVDIVDHRPAAEKVVGTALLRMQAADDSTGQVQVEAKLTGDHRYSARGSYFSRLGTWEVLVIWRKPGFNDVTHVFLVDLAGWAAKTGQKVNPVPATAASVDNGHTLYLTNCAPCHGISGRGDGPSGRALNPAPADLVQHSAPGVHTDGQLFDWISSGYPGSAMPAFKDQLTEKQRWDMINFMRTLK